MRYNPRRFERLLDRYILRQSAEIERLIDLHIRRAVLDCVRSKPSPDGEFRFSDYPALSRQVDNVLRLMSESVTGTIQAGSEWAWNLADRMNDDMLASVLKSVGASKVPEAALRRWGQKNLPALQSFQSRKTGGLGLSDRVWAYGRGVKGDLELALDLGLGEGMSADRLSTAVRRYLREPDRLYRRVRDDKGVLRLSRAASNYHPGQGVYRSAYKNARRLAATETNMAYRTADHDRVSQLDFVLGIEVHLSNNHTCLNSKGVPVPFTDICDELQGRYPKDFVFKGWHPLCRCYTTTILPDKDEFLKYLDAMDEDGHSDYKFENEVTEMPPQVEDWMRDNEYRVVRAKSLPYWIKDNPGLLQSDGLTDRIADERLRDGLLERERAAVPVGKGVAPAARVYSVEDGLTANIAAAMARAREEGPGLQSMAEDIASRHGAVVTPINYKSARSIRRKCRLELELPSELKDTVRTTIIAPSGEIPSVIRELQGREGFMRWKEQRPEQFMGYSGNIVNFRSAGGVVSEIQVNTARMIYAKESPASAKAILGEKVWERIGRETGLPGGLGHSYYEKIRALPMEDPARKSLEARMREYYSHFN